MRHVLACPLRLRGPPTQPKNFALHGYRNFPVTVCYHGCYWQTIHTVMMANSCLYGCVGCQDCKCIVTIGFSPCRKQIVPRRIKADIGLHYIAAWAALVRHRLIFIFL